MKIVTAVLIAAAIAFVVGPQVMSASEVGRVSGACRCDGTSGPADCPLGPDGDPGDCPGSHYSCNMNATGWGNCTGYTSACGFAWIIEKGIICAGASNEACTPR